MEEDADERRLVLGLRALSDEGVVPLPCPDAMDLAPVMGVRVCIHMKVKTK